MGCRGALLIRDRFGDTCGGGAGTGSRIWELVLRCNVTGLDCLNIFGEK